MKKTYTLLLFWLAHALMAPRALAQMPTGLPDVCEVAGPALTLLQGLLLGIATPLGIAAITWGGFLIATSPTMPSNFNKGKTAVIIGIVGLALTFSAYQVATLIFGSIDVCPEIETG